MAWVSTVGLSVSGNTITKTASWAWGNAGGVSSQQIASGDGYVEFSVLTTSEELMAGLSRGDTNQAWQDIDYAVYTYAGKVYVHEAGTSRGVFGVYAAGDRFRVGVEGVVVKYRRNDVVFYQSPVAPSYPLLLDASLASTGATISNAVVSSVQ